MWCPEWSQFMVSYFLAVFPTLLGVLGHETFLTMANICHSNMLFIALLLQGHGDMTSQLIHLQFYGHWCVIFGAEIPISSMQNKCFFSWETLNSSWNCTMYCSSCSWASWLYWFETLKTWLINILVHQSAKFDINTNSCWTVLPH